MADVAFTTIDAPRVLALVARVDIQPFQQLLWDYKDPAARQMFKPT